MQVHYLVCAKIQLVPSVKRGGTHTNHRTITGYETPPATVTKSRDNVKRYTIPVISQASI
jgi:hypothetical protein